MGYNKSNVKRVIPSAGVMLYTIVMSYVRGSEQLWCGARDGRSSVWAGLG